MRMFVALVPPAEVVDSLEDFVEPRREAGPDLRWTLPEQWHVTLAFLPHVPERALDELTERLERAARRRAPLRLTVQGAGAFPNPAKAKVLYASVLTEDPAALAQLATGVRAAANKAGAEAHGGGFRPHVTLARSSRPLEATRLLRVLKGYAGAGWTADEIALVESHLGQGPGRRPRYDVMGTFALGAGGLSSPP